MTTTTETVEPEKPKDQEQPNKFSLLKLAFSTPFAILMLCLSMLSFLKRNDVLSFKGFLDSLVEMFHGVTYAISKWIVWVVDWMLPWWELEITAYTSDVIWVTLTFITTGSIHMDRLRVEALSNKRSYLASTHFGFVLYAYVTNFVAAILLGLNAENGYINDPLLTKQTLPYIFGFALFIIWSWPLVLRYLPLQYREKKLNLLSAYVALSKSYFGAALIILSLYFAGFIKLTA